MIRITKSNRLHYLQTYLIFFFFYYKKKIKKLRKYSDFKVYISEDIKISEKIY